ncbi:MAG: MBL fold metallo-hydrolase [Sedimenticola sp.]
MKRLLLLLALLTLISPIQAFERVQVGDNIYALVGELTQRSAQNLGNNMTVGFIVTGDGVVVIDSGGSRLGAEAIHAAIREVTDKPVTWVINSGGQDHKWFGNEYFIEQGARTIASEKARQDMQNRRADQVSMSMKYLEEKFAGTNPTLPQTTFAERHQLPVEGIRIELIFAGGGHTPGDILVWLPDQSILFSGDTVYVQRLLGVRPGTGLQWIRSLEYIRDNLKPRVVVPGHGHVTDLDEALRDTYDYLVMLRDHATRQFNEGAFDPVEATEGLDQSRFSYLQNYSDLPFRSRNALNMATEVYENQ